MKKGIIFVLVAVLGVPAFAGFDLGLVKLATPNGSGGPYRADVYVDGEYDFDTFCVEKEDTFKSGTTYFATVDDKVMYSPGPDANGNLKSLSDTTKKLYSAYLNGSLGKGQKVGKYYDIQEAVWQAQGSGSFTIQDTAINNALNGNYAGLDITGWKNVMVMNLWKYSSSKEMDYYAYSKDKRHDLQSQLIRLGSGDTVNVPAPGAVLLAGIGTSLVGMIRRRTL